jgi:multiple sugar transport system substrate-binding protein
MAGFTRREFGTLTLSGLALGLAGCASGTGGTTTSTSSQGQTSGVDWNAKGPISYAQGKDISGYVDTLLTKWNTAHPDQKVTLIELPEEADQQRQKMIQNATSKGAAGYDVIGTDVVWTSEFAGNGWILELPRDQFPTTGFLKTSLDTGIYFNRLYAIPQMANGALLFYRKDLLTQIGLTEPPTTWAGMAEAGRKVKALPGMASMNTYGGQFQKYEGLTCNAAEWINSAGGEFLTADGAPAVNSATSLGGMTALQGYFKDGTIPRDALTWKEEESRVAFMDGKLLFLRNWPYVYSLAEKTDGSSKINGKFGITLLPGLTGPGVSTLGGLNMAIPPTAKNPGTCRDFITWWTAPEQQKIMVQKSSSPPTVEALYTDADLNKEFPYLAPLAKSIASGRARPKAVKYGDTTLAIQDAVYNIIANGSDPKSTLDKLQQQLTTLVGK